jgi:hypothetical protein
VRDRVFPSSSGYFSSILPLYDERDKGVQQVLHSTAKALKATLLPSSFPARIRLKPFPPPPLPPQPSPALPSPLPSSWSHSPSAIPQP